MTNPLDTLVARYRTFKGQGGEILTMGREIAGALYQLKQRDPKPEEAIAQLEAELSKNQALYQEWAAANEKVNGAVSLLKSLHIPLPSGLGAVPVVLPAIAIAAVGAAVTAMVLVGGKVVAQRQLLNGIKAGLLTPAEAAAVGKAAGSGVGMAFGGLGVTTLAIAALVLFVMFGRKA